MGMIIISVASGAEAEPCMLWGSLYLSRCHQPICCMLLYVTMAPKNTLLICTAVQLSSHASLGLHGNISMALFGERGVGGVLTEEAAALGLMSSPHLAGHYGYSNHSLPTILISDIIKRYSVTSCWPCAAVPTH